MVQYRKEKEIVKAKALDEKFVEPVPCVIAEIMQPREMMKPEEGILADQDKMDTLSYLGACLNADEQRALCHLLRAKTYGPNECVYRQGGLNFKLYFIHAGRLKITYHQGHKENLLKTLSIGDIAGDDTFFSISVCTTSLTALSPTRLYTLDRKDLTSFRDRMPTLESKLISYCRGLETIYQLLARKRIERRAYERIKVSGRATVQVFQASGAPLGMPLKAQLSDLSAGGLAILCRISRNLDPPSLLGRDLNIMFHTPAGACIERTSVTGTIVAISTCAAEDYCLHIKFDEPWTEKRVEAMARVFQDRRDPLLPFDAF